jgi:hypothetical protein
VLTICVCCRCKYAWWLLSLACKLVVICMRPVEKGEGVPQLRWPLPVDVLAGNPELAQAALADAAAQAHARQQQEAQPRSDGSATEPLEYRESSGSASTCLCACQEAVALSVCTTLDRLTNSEMGEFNDKRPCL